MSGPFVPPGIDDAPDLSALALQALRGDFLYFNVAGSGPTFPVSQCAAERFRTWLNGVGMFSHAGYDAYNSALAMTRKDVARALCDEGGDARVALMQSATEGLNALVQGLRLAPGATIVTTAEEHASALLPIYLRQRSGDRVVVLPYRDDQSFLSAVRKAFAGGAAALVLSLVSCKSGALLPVAEACTIARAAGATCIADGAQALGQIPVDAPALGADAVVVLGHKWVHGPLATGACWIRGIELFEPVRLGWRSRVDHDLQGNVELQPDATRFETGTVDAAAFVGLRQSLAVQAMLAPVVCERVPALRARLLERLSSAAFDVASPPADPTGIVTVIPRGGDAAGIVSRMWLEDRIVVKHLSEPDLSDRVRISFWALHRGADIDSLAKALSRQAAVAA